MDDTTSPARPRAAATVVIARDEAGELQVLLAQRAATLRFMASAHVFPGGAVHASDQLEGLAAQAKSAARVWPDHAGDHHDAHAWAAVRETLEEVGLLLTCDDVDAATVAQLRTSGAWLPALAAAGLRIDLQALIPLARWITPRSEPIRFDTRFYVVRAPSRQSVVVDGTETTSALWTSPTRAIAAAESGEIILPPPTLRTLQSIAAFGSVVELLRHALQHQPVTVEPELLTRADGSLVVRYPDGTEGL